MASEGEAQATTVTGPVDIRELGGAVMSRFMQFPGQFRVHMIAVKMDVALTGATRDKGLVGEHTVLITFEPPKLTEPYATRIIIDEQYYPIPQWFTDVLLQHVAQRIGFEAGMVDVGGGTGGGGGGEEPELVGEPEYDQDPSVAAALAGTALGVAQGGR